MAPEFVTWAETYPAIAGWVLLCGLLVVTLQMLFCAYFLGAALWEARRWATRALRTRIIRPDLRRLEPDPRLGARRLAEERRRLMMVVGGSSDSRQIH